MNTPDLKKFKIDPGRFSSVSVDDLKKLLYNIKNLKPEDLREFINEKQALVLYLIIVIVFLIWAAITANVRYSEYSDYKMKVSALLAKEVPVREYQDALKARKAFVGTIPLALSDADLVSFITQTATDLNIQINSFEPVRRTSSGFFRTVSIRFLCSGMTFQDALAFVRDLEKGKHFVKVNSCSINSSINEFEMRDDQTAVAENQTKFSLSMILDVASIALVENDKKNLQKK